MMPYPFWLHPISLSRILSFFSSLLTVVLRSRSAGAGPRCTLGQAQRAPTAWPTGVDPPWCTSLWDPTGNGFRLGSPPDPRPLRVGARPQAKPRPLPPSYGCSSIAAAIQAPRGSPPRTYTCPGTVPPFAGPRWRQAARLGSPFAVADPSCGWHPRRPSPPGQPCEHSPFSSRVSLIHFLIPGLFSLFIILYYLSLGLSLSPPGWGPRPAPLVSASRQTPLGPDPKKWAKVPALYEQIVQAP